MTSDAWINYFEKTYENFFIKPHAVAKIEEGRLLKVVGRLYPSGKFQIITVLPEEKISASDREYHRKERELNCDE